MNLDQIITLVVGEINSALAKLSSQGIHVEKVDAEVDMLGVGMEEGAEYVRSIKVGSSRNRVGDLRG